MNKMVKNGGPQIHFQEIPQLSGEWGEDNKINIPILAYHQITPESPPRNLKYAVSVSQFKRQMKFLFNNGYKCLPLMEILRKSGIRRYHQRKAIILTFDDGYENFFSLAYPILRDLDFTATVFVITNKIHEQLNSERNATSNFLVWEQIKALRLNGISFGSHCHSHYYLPDLSREEIKNELVVSKNILEARLGEKIQWLSYPYNASTREIQIMAENAGYLAAFGGSFGRNNRFNIWRRECRRDENLCRFIFKLKRWYHYPAYFREHTKAGRIMRDIKRRFDF